MSPGEATLTLTLLPGDGPIAGVVEAEDERVEFSGWIELAALIEGRRPSGRRRFSPSPPSPAPQAAPPGS